MSDLPLQEFLKKDSKSEFLDCDWAVQKVTEVLEKYSVSHSAGNLLLSKKPDEKVVVLTFISNEDLIVYNIMLDSNDYAFKVLRNFKAKDIKATKHFVRNSGKYTYYGLTVGNEPIEVNQSLYIDEFVEKLI